MNALWQWLRLPWFATLRAARIFTLVLQLGLLAGALAAWFMLAIGDGRLQLPLMLLGAAAGYWWMSVGDGWLLLVVDDVAALRMPRTRGRTTSALASAITQTILAPAVLMVCLGAPLGSSALFIVDVSLLMLLWGLVPRYLAVFLGFVYAALIGLCSYLDWPSISDPAFAPLGAKLAAAGLLLVVLRTYQLRRTPDREYSRWTIPMALLLRGQQGVFAALASGKQHCLIGQAQRTPSLDVDFRAWETHQHADPRLSRRLVRMVIGAPFAPRRTLIELRHWGLGIAAVLALEFAGWMLLPLNVLRILNAVTLLWTVLMGVWFVPALASMRLAALFGRQPAAEVALLAHLPGLGDAAAARALLVRATLADGLRRYAVAVAATITAWLLLVGLPRVVPLLLVAALLPAALAGAAMLGALAGRNFDDSSAGILARRALFLAALAILVFTSSVKLIPLIILPLVHKPAEHLWAAQHPWIIAVLALPWGAVFVYALVQLRRNWRAFQRRPQPFMQR